MAEKQKANYVKELTKGFLKENPVLRLVLGTCPTLATSTSVINGIGMGIAATIVLICSNIAISALRKIIPEKARIPAYIVIIASFVTMVQMLVKAFVPALDASLGVFLPLIVVNCIILGRAEAYASKNPVLVSAIDGLGMGIGFTAALFLMGTVREILGAGTFLSGIDTLLGAYIDLGSFTGFDFTDEISTLGLSPMTLFILPAGGFFVFGMLMALANKLAEKKGLEGAVLNGCKGCPHASFCNKLSENGEGITDECEKLKTESENTVTEKDNILTQSVPEEKTKETEIKEPAKDTKKKKAEKLTEKEEKPKEATAAPDNKKDKPSNETEAPDKKEEKAAEKTSKSDLNEKSEQAAAPASRKKNRKRKKPTATVADYYEPLPEVIPEFLKKEIEKNANKEEKAE